MDTETRDAAISTILKYEGDIRKAQTELKEHVAKARAKAAAATAAVASPEKDVLH